MTEIVNPDFANRFDIVRNNLAFEGLVLEFGVAHGTSMNELVAEFQQQFPAQIYHGFDSFQGLPEAWWGHEAGHFACPVPTFGPNVQLHIGWFEDTVPPFAQSLAADEKIMFANIDCDLYSSTKTIFDNLGKHFVPGSIIRFDEYHGYEGSEEHEEKAFKEFLAQTGYGYEVLHTGQMCLIVKLTA